MASDDGALDGPVGCAQPEWVVIGGLIFTPLTAPLIEDAASSNGGVRSYVHDLFTREVAAKNGFNADPARQAVVLLDVLTGGDVNHGYEADGWQLLTTFNGEPVRSLAHLYTTWRKTTARFLEFGFGAGVERQFVLEQSAVRESEHMLLNLHGIPARASAGVLAASAKLPLGDAGANSTSAAAALRGLSVGSEPSRQQSNRAGSRDTVDGAPRPSQAPAAVGMVVGAVSTAAGAPQASAIVANVVGVDKAQRNGGEPAQARGTSSIVRRSGKRNGHRSKMRGHAEEPEV